MAQIAFTAASNHWFWRGKNHLDCQTATLVQMPEDGRITRLDFMVAGLTYNDPVYGYQNKEGYALPAIWDAGNGNILSKGTGRSLPRSTGGTQPWVQFTMPGLNVKAGQRILVGFWRNSANTSIATQWDYCTTNSASGYTTYGHHVTNSSSGPLKFVKSATYSNRSLNFRVTYESSAGGVKVWNGRSWAPGTVNVWNGSRWVRGSARVWTGSRWAEGK